MKFPRQRLFVEEHVMYIKVIHFSIDLILITRKCHEEISWEVDAISVKTAATMSSLERC